MQFYCVCHAAKITQYVFAVKHNLLLFENYAAWYFMHMKKTDAAIKIGQRIAQARKDSGIGSQAALAEACNWLNDVGLPSQGRVSNYESGSREAGFAEIKIIAAATSKDVSFFYSDDLSTLPNLGTFLAEKPTEHELAELLAYLRGMRVTK